MKIKSAHCRVIRQFLTANGFFVKKVKADFDDRCDPEVAFVITIKGQETPPKMEMLDRLLTNYSYVIHWI